MKTQVQQWCENHRDQIGAVLNAIGIVMHFAATAVVRTLWGAVSLLAYVIYNASPDDTLYGLAQFAHKDLFWVAAFTIAAIYSVVVYLIHGPQNRVHMSGGATASGSNCSIKH